MESTPKQKAEELVKKYSDSLPPELKGKAKHFAQIAVQEIIDEYRGWRVKHYLTLEHANELRKYWDEVLEQI